MLDPDSYRFSVFDRWGAKVFSTNDPLQGWNGEVNGKAAQEGVYTYEIRVNPLSTDLKPEEGKDDTKLGVFNLLR
ncbi:MAG: gliding motility-associated C-terminal domain-containing protein [Bacteroidetes bacterium]|nr:gliding motility-associated C-terminal domain-containing protein [Bacteroidota bacterium]